jgi:tRNA dimethylallyltransferase
LADPENPRRVIRALEHLDAHGALPDTWRDAPKPRLVGLRLPRPVLHARIVARVERMFAAGFLDEVAALRARFPAWRSDHTFKGVKYGSAVEKTASAAASAERAATARQAIGYAEACDLLDKRITREQAIAQIVVRTRQLAKRQETWFRHQADVTWIEIAADEPVAAIAARVLAAWREHGPTPIRLS